MATTNISELNLLIDYIKLSLLERQRAISLNLDPNSNDSQISRSLDQLQSGISALESQSSQWDDPLHPSSDQQEYTILPYLSMLLSENLLINPLEPKTNSTPSRPNTPPSSPASTLHLQTPH
jgi:syntaxin 8